MLKKILLGLALVVLAFVVVVATRPAEFSITRTGHMDAPPDVAFAVVNDFHRWGEWSPWSKMDPNQKTTFDGPQLGVGSIYAWAGNDKVGEGRMTMVESKPNEKLEIKLEFLKPMASTHTTTFTFAEKEGGTDVTWTMANHNDFLGKLFCMFADMDAMIGPDFEKGLADMKKVAEADQARAVDARQKKAAEEAAAAAAAAQ